MDTSVKVSNVYKSFVSGKTKVQALQEISFEVGRGEVFGLIGPDGAGKTTLFRILTTLMVADKGDAWVDGFEVVNQYKEIRHRVGYMPGRFSLYQDLTVEENLSFFATLFNTSLEENYDLVKSIYQQIEPFKKRRAGALSGGMKQRLALAAALLSDPPLLMLDEITSNLDANGREGLLRVLARLKESGNTIVFTSHRRDDVLRIADRVLVLEGGKVARHARPEDVADADADADADALDDLA